jgi:hypothetical protein
MRANTFSFRRQTQQIEPSLLPISKSTSLPFSKKADLAIAFSRRHPETGPLVDKVRSRWNDFSLSQMTDAYTQTVPLQCGFEVKERGGDSNEADMQLGIWSAAGLQLLKQQRSAVTGSGGILPFVGGTIVGHEWRVHIAWKDEKGGVVSYSVPCCSVFRVLLLSKFVLTNTMQFDVSQWRDLIVSTASLPEIFVLFRLIERICNWLKEAYWPWLRDSVLIPLS